MLEDEEYVVVNKPASIPVHESGAYRFNSLLFILAKERNLHFLHNMHRLDRLTSGIVIFAKTKDAAAKFSKDMDSGDIQKTYIARVKGEFPCYSADVCTSAFVHGDGENIHAY
jgi:23S rRNA-/tRNA-specific pseudouridylate synthase